MSEATSSARAFSPWEWILAFRYLRAKRSEGGVAMIAAIAFLAITLAIAVLIIVMSIMNGFRSELLSKILGFEGHAYVEGQATWEENYPEVMARLSEVPGVVEVTPTVKSQGVLMSQTMSGVFVQGITPEDLRELELVASNIQSGSLDDFGEGDVDNQEIIIGSGLAAATGTQVGDRITLMGYGGSATPFGGQRPIDKLYTVGAIYEVGMSEYDQVYAFMPLEAAQAFYGRGWDVDAIEIKVEDPDHVDELYGVLREAAGEGSIVQLWQDRHASYWGALQVERNMMRLVLMLIVSIAALNIISALVMLVKNKERDVAILRTIGASQGSVMRVFLISGAAIGALAAPFGVFLGVVFCWNIEAIQGFIEWATGTQVFDPNVYFLTRLPAKLDWNEVWGVFGWTLGISVLVTLYPSWRASKTDPVETLRYE